MELLLQLMLRIPLYLITYLIASQNAAISHDVSVMDTSHPITRHLQRVSTDPGAKSGSLQVTSPAIPIIWGDYATQSSYGTKNPVVIAAAATTSWGKVVSVQHHDYVTSDNDAAC